MTINDLCEDQIEWNYFLRTKIEVPVPHEASTKFGGLLRIHLKRKMIDDRLYVFIFNDKVDRIQPKNGGKDGWP